MPESESRRAFLRRLRQAAEHDQRIVGLLDYGSGSTGRVDEWSDVDIEVYIRDGDFDAFMRTWREWAAQFGELLLAYIGHYQHPWTVYAAEPVPLRVDFDVHRESSIEEMLEWPVSPTSVEAMLLYDATGGRLGACVAQVVGRSLRPHDLEGTFAQCHGDLWYFLLYVYSKLRRGETWIARQVFHSEVMEHLLRLLRLEAGELDRWRGSPAAWDVERTLTAERLARLDRCVPGPGRVELERALRAAAGLGRAVCEAIAARHGWRWPRELAARVLALLQPAPPAGPGERSPIPPNG